jgi:RND superfamily putative drug exporter
VEPAEEAESLPRASAGGPTVVHGFVRDAEGAPVDGAVLTLLSKGGRQLDRVTSLADGSYIVSVPAPGTYLLSATASSYGARARHVVVTDEPLVHDLELTEGEVDAVN